MSIQVDKLTSLEKTLDLLIAPLMHIAMGNFFLVFLGKVESIQRTHYWNNVRLIAKDVNYIARSLCVECGGLGDAWDFVLPRRIKSIPIFIFHIPVLGGWRDYVVLEPSPNSHTNQWYVGWISDDIGFSRVPIDGKAKLLLGPGNVTFFGIDENGEQIPIREIARGRLWDGCKYRKVLHL